MIQFKKRPVRFWKPDRSDVIFLFYLRGSFFPSPAYFVSTYPMMSPMMAPSIRIQYGEWNNGQFIFVMISFNCGNASRTSMRCSAIPISGPRT